MGGLLGSCPRRVPGILILLALAVITLRAAALPPGFTEKIVASGLASPTAMQFAPDGRLFVAEQGGRLRVIKNGALLATPFVTLPVNASGERGLLGVAFDPNFTSNQFVYVYYTATSPTLHNRISRFTASGDVAIAGSEAIVLDLDNLSSATNHNGGAIAFGPDGKLYAAVGDNANGANAQSLNTLHGKMLRLNADGTIPLDNPFLSSTAGKNRAIWALGLRNPFTFAFHKDGRIYINDVGQNTWEEINDGIAGANYGWPTTEGPTSDPKFISPRYAYTHASGGCAITGGAFYDPLTWQFPSEYLNDYFFADYCGGWIRKLDPETGTTVSTFATGITFPVDLKVAEDGSLYYLARGSGTSTGTVTQITFGSAAPSITQHPASRTVSPGATVTFSVTATGATPLQYQWQRNGANITGATSASYTIASAATTDSGARFRVIVSNVHGSTTSNEAVLTVTSNKAPVAAITQPVSGATYAAGMTVNYAGTGNDAEDGTLNGAAFTWWVDFHHDAHTHPHVAPTSGSSSGSFTIPTSGETSANVWYRVYLSVRDSADAVHTVHRDVLPRKVRLTLTTNPAGLQLRLDGQPINTPHEFDSVVGIVRQLQAPTPQTLNGLSYTFASWSDAGAASHNISTPALATAYTATYATTTGTTNGLTGAYYDAPNFAGAAVTRVDPTVNFSWAAGAPMSSMAADTFSVRWTGQVMPQFSETYRFYTVSDDGVRLWVNGQQIINNWTDHAAVENSGTIALAAGQRYDIRMEFYENGGQATARLLWSSPSTPKAVVPTTRLFRSSAPSVQTIRVNFQPAAAPVPAGYLPDGGAIYGARGNGYTYGWLVDNTQYARDRNAPNSPDQRYDTFAHMQWPSNSRNAAWEIAVPNGTYSVRIVAGDPSYWDSVHRIAAEGTLVVSGTPSSASRWVEGTAVVTVNDGRLTVSNYAGASNNKIAFIELTKQ
jgi:glucose/arabinose dehydrogenase